ncbi:tyrosine-type recombinase/integrase [Methylomagnum ishizawai]|uniref:tyrosine-type recombinase/integrase n=1 Tax=Methylomagnum ishizawai TaxID=1760988 RepID=UPI001C33243D|nr:site-specific integrase [Methylomagnum ishizawai]BBL73166.1 hypothetical protein MishRS11D_02640 [Methylomagnum ishizawai]
MQKRNKPRDQDGIYQRPDSPYWWAAWKIGSRTARRSTGIKVADDPRGHEAKRIRAGFIAQTPLPTPQELPTTTHTFAEMINRYLDGPGSKHTPGTRRNQGGMLRAGLFDAFKTTPLTEINGAAVDAFIQQRRAAGTADATIRNQIAFMSSVTNWAIERLEWAIPNPWRSRKPAPNAPRDRWLTPEEIGQLIAAAEAYGRAHPRKAYLPDYIRLCLNAGLRREEALRLTWDRVDLDNGVLHLGRADQKNRKVGAVPLNRTARLALANRKAERQPDNRVFPHTDPYQDLQRAIRHAGLEMPHTTVHDLRRTCGSILAQNGVDIHRIARILRHADVTTTYRTYAFLAQEDLADAAAVLDQPPKLRVVK